MHLAKVIGDVVATRKDENLTGLKLLLIQPLTPEREPAGRALVAVDAVGAGVGEEVFFVRGKEASFPFHPAEPPVDTTVVGIVDEVHVRRTPMVEVGVPVPAGAQAKMPAPVHRKGSRKGQPC